MPTYYSFILFKIIKMKKNYNSKVQKLTNATLATICFRTIDAVSKSGIEQAQNSKLFIQLNQRYDSYQSLLTALSTQKTAEAVNQSFEHREQLFKSIYKYVNGLLNAPDQATQLAAQRVFDVLNSFGTRPYNAKIAVQTIRYFRMVEMLNKPVLADDLLKLQLSNRIADLDAAQREYESQYTGRGDEQLGKVYPSSQRKKLAETLANFYEEMCWLARQHETAEWLLLVATLEKRLDEIDTSRAKSTNATDQAPATEHKLA